MAATAASAQQVDPAYRFQVLTTDHFRIYFHQGEQDLAGRLAAVAEDVWRTLKTSLGRSAPPRTEVILVDQTDLANGWATPVPRDVVAIFAVWPSASDTLKTDDWLRLAFTHEFTHILHLDRSEGWARIARRILGRTSIAFPNLFLPIWQIEGLAVYEESAVTGEGRLHAGDFRAVVGEAARAGRLLPLDRVSGGLTRWPAGQAPYAYGLGFHAFLADRYGAGTLAALADRTARSVPYLGALAFKPVYRKSLGALWREYEDAERAGVPGGGAPAEARRLTHHNFVVAGPRFRASACPGCAPDIYYSVRNADELPALYRLRSGGGAGPERVTTRIFGSTLAAGRQRLYFDQQEVRRNAGLYSDLYSFDPATGRTRRLTHEARIIDPDLSPDGRALAAVRIAPGRRELVVVRLASADEVAGVETLAGGPDEQFNAPRWSPDGRAIAVAAQRLGELPRLVVVDAATRTMRTVAADRETRWATPTWRPDGQALVASAAAGEAPFNLFEIDLATGAAAQLTHTTGGATWPEVSPDGSSIVYVGYTAEGYDLFEVSYGRSQGPEVQGSQSPPVSPRTFGPLDRWTVGPTGVRAYSPWSTLPPTSWMPIVSSTGGRLGIGAEAAGADVLGYHGYAASMTRWLAGRDVLPAPLGSTDGRFAYAYTRRRISPFVSWSRETTLPVDLLDAQGKRRPARQETEVEAGVAVPVVHARTTHVALASWLRGTTARATTNEYEAVDRAAARFGWLFRSAHEFGNSISPERGLAAGVTAEFARRALGSDADATSVTADVRLYLPGLARHHVVAVRAAGGRSTGDRLAGRTFTLGGEADAGLLDFGSGAINLLRGFPSDTFGGTRVALINVDYRFPIARVERGYLAWPVFLHTVHAALFGDVGHVWTQSLSARDLKTSFGAELSANLVVGYWLPLTLTTGVARGHDGSHSVADRLRWYGRIGYAF